MNAKDRQRQINDNLRLLDPYKRHGSYINQFRVNIGNTYAHELAKFEKFWKLRKEGIDCMVEAEFVNGGRCDLIDLENGIVYEFLCTETIKDASEKVKKYPSEFYIKLIMVEPTEEKE